MTDPTLSGPRLKRLRQGAFLTLFGVMCAHALLETARDALFLASIPASQLPWVYLIISVLAIGVTMFSRRGGDSPRNRLVFVQLCAAVVTLGFWWLIASDEGSWVYYALYVWSAMIVAVIVVNFWLFLAELFTIAESKRIFASIGTGGALGVLAGFGLATLLTQIFTPEVLIGASALAFAFSSLGPLLLPAGRAGELPLPAGLAIEETREQVMDCVLEVSRHPYARRVAALIVLSTFTLTLVDYLFKSTVSHEIPAEDLGSWFAGFYFAINVISLSLLAFAVTPMIRRLSLHRASAALPALLSVAALGVLFFGALLPVLLLKSADGALRYSLLKTSRELLYLPILANLRASLRTFVDILGANAAKAAASASILLVVAFDSHGDWIAATIFVLSALWVYAALSIREPYLNVFRESLNEGAIETRIENPELDMASLETLIRALSHPDERHVIAALDLLHEKRRIDLVPNLILYHPSTDVVSRALELLSASGRDDYLPLADRLIEHDDPAIRAAAVRAIWVVRPDRNELESLLVADCSCVQASAAIGLIANGWASAEEGDASTALWRAARQDDVRARRSVAHGVSLRPLEDFRELLLALHRDQDTDIRRIVMNAMCVSGDAVFTPTMVDLLDDRDIREEVRRSLRERGQEALDALEARLSDGEVPVAIARHIPRTISTFGNAEAVKILQRHLDREGSGMVRFKILLGLYAILARSPGLEIDTAPVISAIEKSLERGLKLLHWEAELSRAFKEDPTRMTSASTLLLEFLEDKRHLAAERLFRLLYLLKPDENFRRIWGGLQARDVRTRDHSQELLDNLLPPSMGAAVLALVEHGSPAQLLASAGSGFAKRKLTYEVLLFEISTDKSTALRGFATYHSAEILAGSSDPAQRVDVDHQRSTALDMLSYARRISSAALADA